MAKRTCSVEACERPARALGFCQHHYDRWHRFGSTDKPVRPPKPPCVVPGCDKPFSAKGMCQSHYLRWRRTGDTNVNAPKPSREELFWAKVDKHGSNGCWIWMAQRSKAGYGSFSDPKPRPAHRWCYELLVGPIPVGMELDHQCRVRACVNPGHLEPVTPLENRMRGRIARGYGL